MKFSSTEDIEAPIDEVFRAYSDFDGFERLALRRGAEIGRTDKMRTTGVGQAWKGAFQFRGRRRIITAELTEYSPPDGYTIEAHSPNLLGLACVEMVPLSRNRTRVQFSVELKPKSLSGRLMVQSLKLGKSRLTRGFKAKAADFAKEQETRLKA